MKLYRVLMLHWRQGEHQARAAIAAGLVQLNGQTETNAEIVLRRGDQVRYSGTLITVAVST